KASGLESEARAADNRVDRMPASGGSMFILKKTILGVLWFLVFELLMFAAVGLWVAASGADVEAARAQGAVLGRRYGLDLLLVPFSLAVIGTVMGFLPGTKRRSGGFMVNEFRVYRHPEKNVTVAVKIGISWPAFIVGPLWFLLHGMWINFILVTILFWGAGA